MERTVQMQALVDQVAVALGITSEEQAVLDTNHRYGCRCDTCKRWWKLMGPEDYDENGKPLYGPFSQEEIEG